MNIPEKPSEHDPKLQRSKKRARSQAASYTAHQKCQAILSVWMEKRSPSEICRELSITWTILNQWQERAMEGMLQALTPRVALTKGASLSPRLRALLEKKQAACFPSRKLTEKLKDIQQQSEPATPQTTVIKG
jgi:hypothetical protein